jgi:hypothetical protein
MIIIMIITMIIMIILKYLLYNNQFRESTGIQEMTIGPQAYSLLRAGLSQNSNDD